MIEAPTITQLVDKFSTKLEQAFDIHVADYNLFVYDVNRTVYPDFESLRKDIIAGKANVFFTVDCFLGDDAWIKLEELDEEE